jgi:signal recognition particle subunit SRP68
LEHSSKSAITCSCHGIRNPFLTSPAQPHRCLSIARSHAISKNAANALALIDHAHSLIQDTSSNDDTAHEQAAPLSIDVSSEAASFLRSLLNGELQRYRAIVHMRNLHDAEREASKGEPVDPLISKLNSYPQRVNLRNIVQFPPKMELIPAKPIFLDVAWNYIEYPGQTSSTPASAAVPATGDADQPKKKGWFGFGR